MPPPDIHPGLRPRLGVAAKDSIYWLGSMYARASKSDEPAELQAYLGAAICAGCDPDHIHGIARALANGLALKLEGDLAPDARQSALLGHLLDLVARPQVRTSVPIDRLLPLLAKYGAYTDSSVYQAFFEGRPVSGEIVPEWEVFRYAAAGARCEAADALVLDIESQLARAKGNSARPLVNSRMHPIAMEAGHAFQIAGKYFIASALRGRLPMRRIFRTFFV